MKTLAQRLDENFNESKNLKTIPELIRHTDNKLIGWYKNAKLDYGVVGSGKTRVKDDEIFIDYVEDGKKKTWSMAFHIEYLEYGADYFYNVWMEQAVSDVNEANDEKNTETLKAKVLSELLKMGRSQIESENLIAKHFLNASSYLKSARQIAMYMTA